MHLIIWQFSLQDLDDLLLFGRLDLLRQVDDFLFDVDESPDISPHSRHSHQVLAHNLVADGLDLNVGLGGDLVDEIADGELR